LALLDFVGAAKIRRLAFPLGGAARISNSEDARMYLEDRIRALEDRIATLESSSTMRDDRSIHERIDGVEGTCHDLINGDDALRARCNDLDHRIAGLHRQLEEMLEQLAEMDGRADATSPFEERVGRIERELETFRGVRNEFDGRLGELDRAVRQENARIEELAASEESLRERLASFDLGAFARRLAETEQLLAPLRTLAARLDEHSDELRGRMEELNARLDEMEQTSQEAGRRLTNRFDAAEREANDLRREVAWLRERPQPDRIDRPARWGGAGAAAAAVLALALCFWPHDTIEAKRFVVKSDANGRTAEFSSNESGGVLELRDRRGRRRLYMCAADDGSRASLLDATGAERLRLGEDASIGAGLLAFEAGGRRRLWCGLSTRPALYLFDEEGNVRSSIAADASGGEWALLEQDRRPQVRLTAGRDDNGLRIYDAGGRLRVGVGTCPEGAAVNLFDPAEQRRVVLSANAESAALSFLGGREVQRTTLGTTKEDESILNLHDAAGKQRLLLFASDAEAGVQVLDRDTKILFSGP
jgi:predicted  nucleic acid-binding Zn-ribbon protein